MRAAAIDLGTVRVGLAVSDELGLLAHVRPFLDGRDTGRLIGQLRALVDAEQIDVFVVGLPRQLDGSEGLSARRSRAFAKRLGQESGARVELLDERWTTREALGRLRDQGLDQRRARSKVDSAAAAILLQTWLDTHRPSPGEDADADGRSDP